MATRPVLNKAPEADLLFAKASLLSDWGRQLEARTAFERAATAGMNSPAFLLQLGSIRFATGDLDGAERTFRELIALAPGNPQAHCSLGLALQARGLYDDAAENFARTLELN